MFHSVENIVGARQSERNVCFIRKYRPDCLAPTNPRGTMYRKAYLSDLSDTEWLILAPLVFPVKVGGRQRSVNIRE
jgi:hypothetical protein